ncbi:STAS domain-containing protein [Streptomyces sp. NPDC029003]|uniref:STAS domain-containing protein n=1 Tax=Streptomyces sp. NPDC029003 TaxID=3155125 RepID=UPI0033ED3223
MSDEMRARPQGPVGDSYAIDGIWVVAARGELDSETIGPLNETLVEAGNLHPIVVLDASAVTFADSTCLNMLLRVHRITRLRIAAPRQQLVRLLALTGADTVLDVHTTLDEAVRA